MTNEDIIRMARRAGNVQCDCCLPYYDDMEEAEMGDFCVRFAALIAAAEREACAKVCDAEAIRAKWNWDNDISGNQPFWNGGEQLASSCAAAIRAKSNT